MRPVTVVGAATSAGAYGPGQERAPDVLRAHGLLARLRTGGREVDDVGNVVTQTYAPDPDHPRAGNVDQVRGAALAVAGAVAGALTDGRDVLVLGGDCTVELGTVAGAVADGSSVGLIYVDLDGDLNTPETGDGVLDWMGLAHLLDVPGCEPRLSGLGSHRPLLNPDQVFLVSVDRLTEPEKQVAVQLGLRRADRRQVIEQPDLTLEDVERWAASFDRVLVHLDVDVLDHGDFPIAQEVRDTPVLTFEQLAVLLVGLRQIDRMRALTVCEINPDHAREDSQLDRLATLVASGI
jgi:arginase